MVAKGAQPTSVIFKEIPVRSTKEAIASEKAVVKIPIIALIPVKAIPSLRPPSNARVGFTLKQRAISVKTIVIKGAAPKSIKGLKIVFARSIIVFIYFLLHKLR